MVLQEAAARITIASGKNLGQIIALKYQQSNRRLRWMLFIAVVIGCAAYEAGNLLGAVSGFMLITPVPKPILTLIVGIFCAVILWVGTIKIIAKVLGLVVALMGIAFIYVAIQSPVRLGEFVWASIVPAMPEASALLVIGLIGTTIVPYNLFLASGISRGQSVVEMRWGISIAVLIGGIISMAILVAGTEVTEAFSFEAVAAALSGKLGTWATAFFGFGLFAASMSSAITAPLAAAVTGQSLLANENEQTWASHSRNFRLVWAMVLGIGMVFGISNIQPIPAIILAQALNGILLPVVATFLLLAVNDRQLFPAIYRNSLLSNLLLLLIVGVSCFLGLYNILKAVSRAFPSFVLDEQFSYAFLIGFSCVVVGVLGWRVFGGR